MKKVLCALLALALLGSAALAEGISLKVWGSQEGSGIARRAVRSLRRGTPGKRSGRSPTAWSVKRTPRRAISKTPAAAADVFSYPDDQIIDLVNADALYEVTRDLDAIVAANTHARFHPSRLGQRAYSTATR